ncbi:hypothetical protein SAMN06265360_11784 [Haloechinothrix alba]|uniref:Transposase, Mutator family n=1 Tax=Haloechinothrix alba TaxID=664784 RepID=A0A238YWH4_9PSEU|nr:hypothetical protein SAMN06265360_11784 [Haloechinothrix alba]
MATHGSQLPEGGTAGESSSARDAVSEILEAGLLDGLMDRVDQDGPAVTGQGGFLPELIKAVLGRGVQTEMTDHLGFGKGDPAGWGGPNSPRRHQSPSRAHPHPLRTRQNRLNEEVAGVTSLSMGHILFPHYPQ